MFDSLRDSFVERIARRTVVIDGGLSTQLQSQGVQLTTPLWTGQALLDDPTQIERAHRAFVDAGADVIITASYQLSREGFVSLGLSAEDADKALRASVEVARRATHSSAALVAASVGPYGAILHDGSEYRGNYGLTSEELIAFHRTRLAVLSEANPDLFAIETIPDLVEVEAILSALEVAPEIPAWLSVTLGADGQLWASQSLPEVVRAIEGNPQIVAVGVNCLDPNLVPAALTALGDATQLPIIVYANGGGTWSAELGEWSSPSHVPSAATLRQWMHRGARAVGGCCGIDARDLNTMARYLAEGDVE